MKRLLYILFSVCLTNVYGQRQVSLLADLGIQKNNLTPYFQTSVGILYRAKQNTFGITIDNVGITYNHYQKTGFYHIIGGTAFFSRHLNKKKLSGIYIGTYISYTQFAKIYDRNIRYNEPPPTVYFDIAPVGPYYELHQFQQFKIVPTFGYEYYPLTRLSIFTELGYGILYAKTVKTDWQNTSRPTSNSIDIYGNLNLKLGIKTVLWRSNKKTAATNIK